MLVEAWQFFSVLVSAGICFEAGRWLFRKGFDRKKKMKKLDLWQLGIRQSRVHVVHEANKLSWVAGYCQGWEDRHDQG